MAAQKNKLNFYFILFSLGIVSFSCHAENVIIDNSLSKCLVITKESVVKENNLLLLNAKWNLKDNIGVCGCKSAAVSYNVHLNKSNRLMSHGILSSLNKSHISFVLSSDNTIYKNSKYLVSISCANP